MLVSVDSGTVDAPSYPAIAVWANPAIRPLPRSTEKAKAVRASVFSG
jgi:hypothetical protein